MDQIASIKNKKEVITESQFKKLKCIPEESEVFWILTEDNNNHLK